jgi:hypothetical protein
LSKLKINLNKNYDYLKKCGVFWEGVLSIVMNDISIIDDNDLNTKPKKILKK